VRRWSIAGIDEKATARNRFSPLHACRVDPVSKALMLSGVSSMSFPIILSALAILGLGAILLTRSGPRRLEVVVSFCGVALVASGLAMVRDGVNGSRSILWAMPGDTVQSRAPAAHALPTGATMLRSASAGN
jgi:hypothetical protein